MGRAVKISGRSQTYAKSGGTLLKTGLGNKVFADRLDVSFELSRLGNLSQDQQRQTDGPVAELADAHA